MFIYSVKFRGNDLTLGKMVQWQVCCNAVGGIFSQYFRIPEILSLNKFHLGKFCVFPSQIYNNTVLYKVVKMKIENF
jgi:hypothetical protein